MTLFLKWKSLSHVWLFATPWTVKSVEFSRPNTGVSSLPLLRGIFPTQGSNPGLLHRGWILYQLSHKGSPRILEWVTYPFSKGSSRPRNRTRVSCVEGRFFTNWAFREVTLGWILYCSRPEASLTGMLCQYGYISKVDRVCAQSLCHVWLFVSPWAVACQGAPLSMEFSREPCWNGLPFPTPEA